MDEIIEPTCGNYILAYGYITCRCGEQVHGPDKPHVCVDHDTCGGSWFGNGITKESFKVVRYPLLSLQKEISGTES